MACPPYHTRIPHALYNVPRRLSDNREKLWSAGLGGHKARVSPSRILDAFSRAPHGENIFVFLMRLMDINANLPWIGTLNSFSFRPWIGLIWEISAHSSVGSAWNFGARLFCQVTKMLGIIDICYINVFQDTVSEKCSCPNIGRVHIGPWPGPHMGLAHIDMI